MNMFDFTEEDLKSNKRGFLSPQQKERISMTARGMLQSSNRGVWIGTGFAIFGACLMLALFLQNESTRKLLFSNLSVIIALSFTVLAAFLIMSLGVFLVRKMTDKLQKGEILTAEGVIKLDQGYSENSGISSYYVFIGKKRFAFTEDMSGIFPEGTKFRLYYCKAGAMELILSFEKVV